MIKDFLQHFNPVQQLTLFALCIVGIGVGAGLLMWVLWGLWGPHDERSPDDPPRLAD